MINITNKLQTRKCLVRKALTLSKNSGIVNNSHKSLSKNLPTTHIHPVG